MTMRRRVHPRPPPLRMREFFRGLSLEERAKLVFLIEARSDTPEKLRVGQPVSVSPIAQEASR